MELQLHCDNCGKSLGTYLYGKGGIEERAHISGLYNHRLPDITCNECLQNYSKEEKK